MMNDKLFNTPFEMMLRILLVLSQDRNHYYSLDKIVFFDFVSCYASDFQFPYPNLHGDNYYNMGEIANRRQLAQKAIKLMAVRGLINIKINEGYIFSISKSGVIYAESLKSTYAEEYKKIVKLVIRKYRNKSGENIINVIYKKVLGD